MKHLNKLRVALCAAAIIGAVLAYAAPRPKECECKNNPSKNEGTCVPLKGDNTKTGYHCVKTGGNKDCYATTCEEPTIGGGGTVSGPVS